MLIKVNYFKRMIKEAYKGSGLTVGASEHRYHIAADTWELTIDKKAMPNKAKAALVELIGKMPVTGEAIDASKDEYQEYDMEQQVPDVEEYEEKLDTTRMLLWNMYGTQVRVLQGADLRIKLVKQEIAEAIEPVANGEETTGPMCDGMTILWWNSTGTFWTRTESKGGLESMLPELERITITV